ncbi:hypothetical protein EII28_11920 [Fusobacterium nucleatum]|uniref:Uncharacterized protein n=2 Tax=Bacteria TaxID=2 RepID=A0A3P1VJU8_FUSNU|nr:hypothetical protein [Fusobacterium nucleatum]RRD34542.1 hypothetical protein EII28_11920 [Fusobacterium nucleatum]
MACFWIGTMEVKADEINDVSNYSGIGFRSAVLPEFGYGAVHGVTNMGYGVTCWQVGNRNLAKCSVDWGEVAAHTGRVMVNGWVDSAGASHDYLTSWGQKP